jgi:Domain of unknown function (DUF4926)
VVKPLDVVALLEDRPDLGLAQGEMGTAVGGLSPGVWEVEFADDSGRTYARAALKETDVLVLRSRPVPV